MLSHHRWIQELHLGARSNVEDASQVDGPKAPKKVKNAEGLSGPHKKSGEKKVSQLFSGNEKATKMHV